MHQLVRWDSQANRAGCNCSVLPFQEAQCCDQLTTGKGAWLFVIHDRLNKQETQFVERAIRKQVVAMEMGDHSPICCSHDVMLQSTVERTCKNQDNRTSEQRTNRQVKREKQAREGEQVREAGKWTTSLVFVLQDVCLIKIQLRTHAVTHNTRHRRSPGPWGRLMGFRCWSVFVQGRNKSSIETKCEVGVLKTLKSTAE